MSADKVLSDEQSEEFFDVDKCMAWCSIENCNKVLMKEIEGAARQRSNWKRTLSIYRHQREAKLININNHTHINETKTNQTDRILRS